MASRFVFTPESAQLPSSNFPSFKKDSQGRSVLAFDASTSEEAYWVGIAPQNFVGVGGNCVVVVNFYTPSTTTTTHNVVFVANVEAPSSSEDLDAGSFFAQGISTTTTVPSVAGAYKQAIIELPSGNIDGLAAGNYFRLRIARDAANALDTAAGDAHVLAVEFRDVV